MKINWDIVKKEHVLQALKRFDASAEKFPEPRNTFLIVNNRSYPAKHIRGIAYKVATEHAVSKNDYSGGEETARFFRQRGFVIKRGPIKRIASRRKAIATATAVSNGVHLIGRVVLIPDRDRTMYSFAGVLRELYRSYQSTKLTFLVTQGGCIEFPWPKKISKPISVDNCTKQEMAALCASASEALRKQLSALSKKERSWLKQNVRFIAVGLDGSNAVNSIELVGIYDVRRGKVTHWTGKSHPVNSQKDRLVKVTDLETHFINLAGHKLMVLGCHDLNMFSPRSRATAKGSKHESILRMASLMKKYKPEVVLQLPHKTDSPNIWNLAWKTLEKDYASIEHYASGILYYRGGRKPRGVLQDVCDKTKKGDVMDFVLRYSNE